MAATTALYTPRVLSLATSLAQFPPRPELPLHGTARSQACGSTLVVDLATAADGSIARIGLAAHACAIGQASAAIFALHALDRTQNELADTLIALQQWLEGSGPIPDWPDLDAIAAARDFPGRHGAMLLPWKAALDALSTAPNPR